MVKVKEDIAIEKVLFVPLYIKICDVSFRSFEQWKQVVCPTEPTPPLKGLPPPNRTY